jgi:hypothetical protein
LAMQVHASPMGQLSPQQGHPQAAGFVFSEQQESVSPGSTAAEHIAPEQLPKPVPAEMSGIAYTR